MSVRRYLQQHKRRWIGALLLVISIKIFSSNESWVEELYTSKFYFFLSKFLRLLFGWIPFSLGDILYFMAGCWLLWKVIRLVQLGLQRKISRHLVLTKSLNIVLGLAFVYIIFNVFWGINYNRRGIAYQLSLTSVRYDTTDLIKLQTLLLQKVNTSKSALMRSREDYPSKDELFKKAKESYGNAEKMYPFLQLDILSVKSSLYGTLGDYLGFTGYYNPFTGEAQVNTTVPKFLQPYITTHEMAHQLGYAKENEANFVGYLAAINLQDTLFHYSAYFDLFLYTNREVYYFDSALSKKSIELLNPDTKKDIKELRQFNLDHQNFLAPLITWMYGKYLKFNQQPQGMRSYNAVVAMLIAYYKKHGRI